MNNNDLTNDVRSRIKAIMMKQNLSVNALSAKLGIKQTTLNRQIIGASEIGSRTIIGILESDMNISAEWLLRGVGEMHKNGSGGDVIESEEIEERVPEKEVLLVPAGARGGSLDHFEEQVGLNAYNAEVIRSPFINASLALMIKNDSMAPDYPAGTYLFLKQLTTDVIEWGQCYVLDTLDGAKFYCIQPSPKGDDYLRCVPLNSSGRYAPFDVPKNYVTGVYKTLGAMKW